MARTMSGFTIVAGALLSKADSTTEVDTELQTIFVNYLAYSGVNHDFNASIRLLALALNFKTALNIQDNLLKSTIDRYWADYLAALKSSEPNELVVKNSEQFLKTILAHNSSEELVDLLEAEDVVSACIRLGRCLDYLSGYICRINRTL